MRRGTSTLLTWWWPKVQTSACLSIDSDSQSQCGIRMGWNSFHLCKIRSLLCLLHSLHQLLLSREDVIMLLMEPLMFTNSGLCIHMEWVETPGTRTRPHMVLQTPFIWLGIRIDWHDWWGLYQFFHMRVGKVGLRSRVANASWWTSYQFCGGELYRKAGREGGKWADRCEDASQSCISFGFKPYISAGLKGYIKPSCPHRPFPSRRRFSF